jgi:G2/mitotic-specific cyclin 3/4
LGTNTNSTVSSSVKTSIPEGLQLPQTTKPRTLAKRVTTIYKDTTTENSEEASSATVAQSSVAPLPPVHQTLGPRQHKSQPQLKVNHPILRRTQSKIIGTSIEEPQPPVQSIEKRVIDEEIHEPSEPEPEREKATSEALLVNHEEIALSINANLEKEQRELPALPLTSELEEFSGEEEEEEEEEVYDDQGYTTAHSYRSRGDNTTGGATTVLFPKVTSKVKRELAEAKDLVESSRTQDEIEDEIWDTTMVAEYGDEIFEYMRELEVCSHQL